MWFFSSVGTGASFIWKTKKHRRLFFLGLLLIYIPTTLYHWYDLYLSTGLAYCVAGTIIGILPFFFVVGVFKSIYVYFKGQDLRDKQQRFKSIFESIGLKSREMQFPMYLAEKENEYTVTYAFQSLIPINEWESKRALMETYLNAEITRIYNSESDNNIMFVEVVTEQLPQTITFETDLHLLYDRDTLNIGVSYDGDVTANLNRHPHMLVAGETGSGKSNILKCMIYQCLEKGHEVKLIDFKRGISFAVFDKSVEIYSDYDKIKVVLEALVNETNKRLDLLRENRVEDINGYNTLGNRSMRRIVVIIDELAELMRASDKETSKSITNSLETLTRLSRAVGINLIMGIQRPDATIINGQIKNNISLRICGRFVDPEPSRIVLGSDRATSLPNIRGRFIFKDDSYRVFQAFRFTDDTVSINIERSSDIEKTVEPTADTLPLIEPIQEEPTEPKEKKINFNFDDIEI